MEEESERLKEEERCDAGDMQLLATSPRPGEITFLFLKSRDGAFTARCMAWTPRGM